MIKDEKVLANSVFAFLGIMMGYFSFVLAKITQIPELNVLVIAAMILLAKFAISSAAKITRKWNWWLSNGVALSILLWIVVWTIFYNI